MYWYVNQTPSRRSGGSLSNLRRKQQQRRQTDDDHPAGWLDGLFICLTYPPKKIGKGFRSTEGHYFLQTPKHPNRRALVGYK
jgi:hypothetical protein